MKGDFVKPNVIPKRSQMSLSRRDRDGSIAIIILNNSRHYFIADGIRAEVWSLIDGKRSLKNIAAKITQDHGIEESVSLKKIQKIISEFKKEKLLV